MKNSADLKKKAFFFLIAGTVLIVIWLIGAWDRFEFGIGPRRWMAGAMVITAISLLVHRIVDSPLIDWAICLLVGASVLVVAWSLDVSLYSTFNRYGYIAPFGRNGYVVRGIPLVLGSAFALRALMILLRDRIKPARK